MLAIGAKASVAARLSGYIELMRPHNLLVSATTTYIGYTAAALAAGLPLLPPSPAYALAALVVVLVAAGGYVVNDYYDAHIDAVDKPWRPIPSGRVSPRAAHVFAVALLSMGVAIAATIGPISALYAAVVSILLYEYSRWVKRTGFYGNLVVSFNSASSILYGALVACEYHGYGLSAAVPALVPFMYAFLLVLGREVVKGIEDYYGDRSGGVQTLAVLMGPRRAAYVASILLGLVAAISPIPYITGLYGLCYLVLAGAVDALIAASIAILLASQDPVRAAARPRRLLKIAFFVGALAFIFGGFC